MTTNNLKQVFDKWVEMIGREIKWVEMIGREIKGISKENYALLFFADITQTV